MTTEIIYESKPTSEQMQILYDGLAAHAKLMKGLDPIQSFAYFIKDSNGHIKGGCNGCLFFGCLYVDTLWVDKELRGKKYGTQLMSLAEQFGRKNTATFATVNTMDWEALDFYKKLGYHVEFERHGFVKDSIFYFLRKDF